MPLKRASRAECQVGLECAVSVRVAHALRGLADACKI